jgi:hypothetical protein
MPHPGSLLVFFTNTASLSFSLGKLFREVLLGSWSDNYIVIFY